MVRAMPRRRRLLCLAVVILMSIPLPGAFSEWKPADITPSAVFTFPPGGGTCSTGLRVPADGLVKGAVLNVTGAPTYLNHSWSANDTEIWAGALDKSNLTLSQEGVGLGGFGGWWEETAVEAWGTGKCQNLSLGFDDLGLATGNRSGWLLSPALNVSAHSRIMVQGDFPNGTNYAVDILDPAADNLTLQSGLRNGDELDLSLWAEREAPYRELVMRLNLNTSDLNVTPSIRKWGVGTGERICDDSGNLSRNNVTSNEGRITLRPLLDQVKWVKSPFNPILEQGADGTWESGEELFPRVIEDLGIYKMWYSAGRGSNSRIGLATSLDGVAWTRYGGNPVLDLGTSGAWDSVMLCTPSVIKDGKTYKMWYTGAAGPSPNGMGYATSPDGISWTKHPNNPVLSSVPGGSWERDVVQHCAVIKDGTVYKMWYSGYEGSNSRIGLATSNDGVTWTKHAGNPVLDLGPAGQWDATNVGGPAVIKHEGQYYMWYFGRNGFPASIGLATSPDGITWTRLVNNPVLDVGPRAWDGTLVYHPDVVWDGKRIQMWYIGYGGSGHQIGQASGTNLYPSKGWATSDLLEPFHHTYGNLFVNATTPANTGYWINVTDGSNNTLLSYLKNGDPILVNATKYPNIRLNLTLWTDDRSVSSLVHEWGYGTRVSPFTEFRSKPLFEAVSGNWTRAGDKWKEHFDQRDLNGDGYLDIVVSNHYNPSYTINSYVFWGSASGYSSESKTELPTMGAMGSSTADLNDDGYPDIVFSNFQKDDTTYSIDSYIYWGSASGYSSASRTGLPTHGAYANSIADLNGDGYLDIVFSNGNDGSSCNINSYIYWGSASGYSSASRAELPTHGTSGNSIADLNGDGYLDIVFSNGYNGISFNINSYVYWGSASGFSSESKTELPTHGAHGNSIADLNDDSYLDIVFSNSFDGSSVSINSYIYWGSANGFSSANKTELPTVGVDGNSIADLNNDGYPDIVFSNYYSYEGYIYWGSASGYSAANRTNLDTRSPKGNAIADLNGDGFLDIVFSNHYASSHNTDTYVYWGSSTGFSSGRRTDLATHGAYGISIGSGTVPSGANAFGSSPLYPPSILLLPSSLDDSSISIDVRFTGNPKYMDGMAGVLFGYQNSSQYYYVVLKNYGNKIEVWEKMWNRTAPIRLANCDFTVDENITYKLAVEVGKTAINVSVNGTKYLGVNATVENGRIGFMTSYANAEFCNLNPMASFSSSSQLAVVPASLSIGPNGKTPLIRLRLSPDNATWSSWLNVTSNRTYSPSDFNLWGPYLQYNITLNTSDPNITQELSDFRIDYCPYLVGGTITGRALGVPEGTLVSAEAVVTARVPAGASLELYLSADGGTHWQRFMNGTDSGFLVKGAELRWMMLFLGDGNGSALLEGLDIHYTVEHYPSDVRVDVAGDGLWECAHAGSLSGTVPASNLTEAINAYIAALRTEAVGGYIVVPVNITSRTGGIVILGDAAVDFAPSPHVLSHSPTGTNVSLNASINISFSESMNANTLNISIIPPMNLTPSGSMVSKNATFTHLDFRENTTYNVTVKAGGLSAEGAPLLENYSWTFTTEKSIILVDSPKIIDWAPRGNRTATKPTIMVSFDREMSSDSVWGSLSLDPHVGLYAYSRFNTSYNFTLASELSNGTSYTVFVSTAARSAAGKPLAATFIWNFTTVPIGEIDSSLPTVIFTDPSNGTVGVERNRTVSIVFSEAMNKSSTLESFSIYPEVNGTKSWLNDKGVVLQFQATGGFPAGTYNIVLSSNKAKDESGNLLDGNHNGSADGAADDFGFGFTVIGPRLLSKSPEGKGIGLSEPIRLAFDRKMNLSSVIAAFDIQPLIQGSWDISQDGRVVTFTPTIKYRPGWTYNITLNEGLTDVDGNFLGRIIQWSFTTKTGIPTEKGEFPWWILAVLLIIGLAGALAYWKLRKGTGPKPEEAAARPAETPPEAIPVGGEQLAAPLPEVPPIQPSGQTGIASTEAQKPTMMAPAGVIAYKNGEVLMPAPVVSGQAPAGFAVEDVFLMYRDGRLIQHTTRRMKADMDVEIMTSMLKAVQDFVKESIGMEKGTELGSMEYGESKILLEKGRHVILAAMISGGEPDGFRDEMKGTVKNIESEHGSVLPGWDGTTSTLAGTKRFLSQLGAYAAPRVAAEEKGAPEVSLKGELEFYQGFVRLKVAIKNSMPTLIVDTSFRLVYNKNALRLDHIEPEYLFEEGDVRFGNIKPREKVTVAFYLDPQICTESHMEGVLTFRDARDNLETVKLKKILASVVCPIMFTDENINTAMLKRMAVEELDKKDTKVFSIPPGISPERAFDIAKSAVQHHDARLVREFKEKTPFIGEAWYFGKAKGREDRLVIRTRVLGVSSILEFFVASGSTLMLTGMLAELKSDLNKELDALKGKPVMKQVTKPEEVDAVARIKSLLDKEWEAESIAGETETEPNPRH